MAWLWCALIGVVAGALSAKLTNSRVVPNIVVGTLGAVAGLLAVTVLGFHTRLGYSTMVSGASGEALASFGGALTLLVLWSQVRPWLAWRL